MARLGIMAAAETAGVSRATIWRAIKAGRLSTDTDARGRRVIDSAELLRVFGDATSRATSRRNETAGRETGAATPATLELLEELRRTIARLEADLDRERANSTRLLGVVENQQRLLAAPQPPTPTRSPRPRQPRPQPPPATPTLSDALGAFAGLFRRR